MREYEDCPEELQVVEVADEEECPVCGGWAGCSKHAPYCSAGCAVEGAGVVQGGTMLGYIDYEDFNRMSVSRR